VYPLRYEFNGKHVVIPDKEIDKLVDSLEISQQEAIDLWLADNGFEEDEEQVELDKKASKVQISKEVAPKKSSKPRKPIVRTISDERKELFSEILSNLEDVYKGKVKILNENKLISVEINDIQFKIDIIQVRKPKNK
jgi:hypothetical protein